MPTCSRVHRVLQGDRAGYHLNEVVADGHLVLVSAGSAHGVAPLAGGLSPFHFARHRLLMHRTAAHAHVDGLRPARRSMPGGR